MRLSDMQRRVLYAVTLNANASVKDVAKMLGMRDHMVRRTVSLLLENRAFIRRSIWFNASALGLTHYIIHLELPLRSIAARKTFLDVVCASEETSAVVELGGDAQFELRIFARDSLHVATFFEKLAENFRFPFRVAKFLTTLEIAYSGPHDSGGTSSPIAPLSLGPLANSVGLKRVDQSDHLILSALANQNYLNLQQVARALGMPATTLQYRISKLESAGIISGHFYLIDPKVLDNFPVCLQVRSRFLRERERAALKRFARQHPRVSWIGFFLGEQSAEIYTLVQNFDQAQSVIADLSLEFKDVIESVHMTPQLNFFKYSTYPFRNFETLVGSTSK